ncbi:MAG: FG-GAP repeat protein, partial [Lentisphaerae bacterium]|nr:FG-GAP repeat protein [Lentisphaerota bacterium]
MSIEKNMRTAVVVCVVLGMALTASADTVPDGVAPDAWGNIKGQLQTEQYAFRTGEDAAAIAVNRANGFDVKAGKTGLIVGETGALVVHGVAVGWGEQRVVLPDAEPAVDGARVEYRRGPVVEWYENGPEGVEQGFEIAEPVGRFRGEGKKRNIEHRTSNIERPSEDQSVPSMLDVRSDPGLWLEVAFETAMGVEVAEDGQAVLLTDADGNTRYRYDKLHVFDATGRELSSHFESLRYSDTPTPPHRISIIVDDADATYPLTIDPILSSWEKKLTAADGDVWGTFGESVSVAGDVIVVGAIYDD